MPFAFLYSRKNKVFTSEEQNKIDKICRDLGKYTKKKFTINFNIEENRDYGSTIRSEKYADDRDRVTQSISYQYIFSDCNFKLYVNKIFALNDKESMTLLKFGKWDKKHLNLDGNGKPLKNIRAKDICGITLVSSDKFKKRDPKFHGFDHYRRSDLMGTAILIKYNSKWQNEFEDQISKYFKSIAKHVK
jgi:hypothetical protein